MPIKLSDIGTWLFYHAGKLEQWFSMFYQCAEALVCNDQYLVKQATFCRYILYLLVTVHDYIIYTYIYDIYCAYNVCVRACECACARFKICMCVCVIITITALYYILKSHNFSTAAYAHPPQSRVFSIDSFQTLYLLAS